MYFWLLFHVLYRPDFQNHRFFILFLISIGIKLLVIYMYREVIRY